jgi:predicted O-methyltransferase YrrM
MTAPRPTADQIRSIYKGIESRPGLVSDTQGWNSDGPMFAALVERVKPKVIIEVGSWKGASAIHMARLAPEAIIYAVDCWLPPIGVGLGEFPRTQIPERFEAPTFYHQFLFNIRHAEVDHQIIPVRGLTVPIASCLGAWGVKAQLIYIDASHDELSAGQDMTAYDRLLAPGGIMCGDDYSSHEGVRRAVQKFARGRTINEWKAAEGSQWSLDPK